MITVDNMATQVQIPNQEHVL